MSCLFCQIISGNTPSEMLYQDEEVVAFRDINPQAPVHILIVPRKHIAALTDVTNEDAPILSKMALVAGELAEREGISEKGYRITISCGPEGGQLVAHVHMHLLGGRQLSDQLG